MGDLLLGDMFQEMMWQVSNLTYTANATVAESQWKQQHFNHHIVCKAEPNDETR